MHKAEEVSPIIKEKNKMPIDCGGKFKSQTDKKKHKQEYPNGSCANIELKGGLEMEEKKEEIVEEVQEEESTEAVKEIVKIKMPKEQAKEEWKKYVDVLKKRKEKYLKTMKAAMYHMKEGRELIDVYKVMKAAGLNENNQPRLAIARADLKEVYFEKRDAGSGIYGTGAQYSGVAWNKDRVSLPDSIFKIHWERKGDSRWDIEKKVIKTKVPMIPVEILPDGDLKNYYILWEADEWEELPQTKDPLLLKRISENLFVILGAWDTTELEQSIISGGK